MNFITHLTKKNPDFVKLEILHWVFNQPNYILSETEKSKLLSHIFTVNHFKPVTIETALDQDNRILGIECDGRSYAIITGDLTFYYKNKCFEQVYSFSKIYALTDHIIPDDFKFKIEILRSNDLILALDKILINDSKTQYFIDEYIEFLNSSFST